MDLPNFLTRHTDGEISLTGHRIGLFDIVYYAQQGDSPEMVSQRFPTLSLSLIQQSLAFYEANRKEVDAYVAACQADLDRHEAEPTTAPTFDELQRRLKALSRSEAG